MAAKCSLWSLARWWGLWIVALGCAGMLLGPAPARAKRPPTDRHVPELADCLGRVQIAEPVVYRQLAVYPVLLEGGAKLRGRWLSLDAALARGVLVVSERGPEGSVPVVIVENRSRDEHVLILGGEILAGGKQTRTVRNDVVLSPGERVELHVFCVEAHRWAGKGDFVAGKLLVPQSIQQELRKGADQGKVWSEVARNNAALAAENATGSLETALKSKDVQDKLGEVRRAIAPHVPDGTVGFIFVERGRAAGIELFGSETLARELLPKLLDSYAVDGLIVHKFAGEAARPEARAAIEFYERVCRAGSERAKTPGSGAGIRTRGDGLLGDGVSLDATLVHFGVQTEHRIVPLPKPMPRPPIVPQPR